MNRKFNSPLIFFLLFILSLKISIVKSQPNNPFNTNNDNRNPNFSPSSDDDDSNNNNNVYTNPKFSPSVAIIVVILVAALFFMGFFSIYIRQCSDANNLGRGNSVRNGLAFAQRDRTAGGRGGLEASVIETFPTFSYSEVRDHKIGKGALECAVCLNEFEDDEKLRLIPRCDHVFHPECIDAWLENHVTCPVCRSNLTPQDGDEPYRLPELNQENNNVAIQVDVEEEQTEVKPEVNRVWSFKYSNRPPRSESLKVGGRNMLGLGKFRSHSTGHLIQPGENVDRFTLRLPEELRKEMMNRALLNRAKTVAVHLPRDESSTARRWFRTGLGEGSMKGISSLPKVNEPDRAARSDRWLFFTRKVSMKSTKVVAENGEASTSTIETTQSFKNKEPTNIDEKSLLRSEPVQPSI